MRRVCVTGSAGTSSRVSFLSENEAETQVVIVIPVTAADKQPSPKKPPPHNEM